MTRHRSPRLTETSEAAARKLVGLYAERIRLTHAMAQVEQPTAAMVTEILDVGDALDLACETFRRRFFPARARVLVGLYCVLTVSATGRSTEALLDLFDEYVDEDRRDRTTSAAA